MRAMAALKGAVAAAAAAVVCASMVGAWCTLAPAFALAAALPPATGPLQVTIAIAGDVIPHDRIVASARDRRTGMYDFGPMLAPIAPYLARADYAVCNLETPLAGPATGYSGYPLFNAPVELAQALKAAGIDLCTTANNHCLDRGWPGLVTTLDHLDQTGLAHAGTNRSLVEKRTPLVVDLQGIKVGFLVYTATLNGHTPPSEHKAYAVNLLDRRKVTTDAAMARLWGAEVVIAIMHWGDEYQRRPSAVQVRMAEGAAGVDGLLACGVDAIIGHHPHVVQPLVRVARPDGAGPPDAFVAYSLGNLLSNQPWRYTDSGLIAYVHVEKNGFRVRVTGVSYLPVYVQRHADRYPTTYRVLPVLPGWEPAADIALTKRDRARMEQVWTELEPLLHRPADHILPLDPARLGL
jgi:poly-gamma-glutamate synthesis protein (capsule biosynthesis protein)